jgi:hypothetical protein
MDARDKPPVSPPDSPSWLESLLTAFIAGAVILVLAGVAGFLLWAIFR